MSKPEIDRLTRAIEAEAAALDGLCAAMRERRMAYIAMMPSELDAAVRELDVAAEKVRLLGEHRAGATRETAAVLGLPDDTELRDLLPRLPSVTRIAIDKALDRSRRQAHAIGVEQRVGARLLDFSRRSQEAMFVDLMSLAEQDGATTYDRRARSVQYRADGGSLVRGTL